MNINAVKILYFVFLLATPHVINILSKKISFIKKLGPLICCYGLGFLLAAVKPVDNEFVKSVAEIFLILAIPLFLFSSNISYLVKSAPKMLTAFGLSVISVFMATFSSSFLFQNIPFVTDLSGALAGVFTGGTLNLSALAIVFDMPANVFVLINTIDAIAGGLYFLVLLKWGKKLIAHDSNNKTVVPQKNLTLKNFALVLLLAAIVVGISVGANFLFLGKIDIRLLFLLLTILGLMGSKLQIHQKTDASYHLGDYFILIFCFSLSQLINFESLGNFGVEVFGYTACVIIIVIIIYSLLCKLFKIDRENATITHVASIYGPAFVVVYSNYLKKPRYIAPGMAVGLLGYTVGTFLGIFVRDLLLHIFQS